MPSALLPRFRVLAVLGTVVAGWLLGRMLFPPPAPAVADAKASAPREVRSGPPSPAIRESNAAPPTLFAAGLAPRPDRAALRREGIALAESWPASADEVYRRAFELSSTDPAAGLTLLEPLHERSIEGITTLERELVRDWSERDQSGLQAELERLFREDGTISDHWLALAASVVQVENPARLDEMLVWLDTVEKTGGGSLSSVAISKLITHFASPSLPSVTNFLLHRAGDPVARESLLQLASVQARLDPERALDWIGGLPDDALRRETLLAVMAAVSAKDPTLASDWINNGRLWAGAKVGGQPASPEDRALREEALMTYFGALVSAHPHFVTRHAGAIADPASRERLLAMARQVARVEQRSPTDYWGRDAASQNPGPAAAPGPSSPARLTP